jgi:hypothetical protein
MNVEAGVWLRGTSSDTQLAELWDWAESMWEDPRSEPWLAPAGDVGGEDELEPVLLAGIEQARRRDPVFRTLGARPAPNLVTEVNRSGVFVETERTKAEGRPPQLVPAWMFNLAWDALRARGTLSNKELLTELRVHRSSAVCAILSRLPGVEREGRIRGFGGTRRSAPGLPRKGFALPLQRSRMPGDAARSGQVTRTLSQPPG